ncbi:NAD(P)H-dependent flavin oxidoreductase [Miltoncostaea marina]|uniref:NAD(P)H-dependent flavin oxidoreductase n=1 Tax=Miltoncostaea marina TaxID=2843215 RepID=UPI001C3C9AE2|nr:nitronate monooxygenase [Miltoncostaea marina]
MDISRPALGAGLCELLGIRHPVLLAGMAGGPTSPELVAAVSEAGGLGAFGLTGMGADAARAAVRRAVGLTSAPIGVNVLVAPATEPDPSGGDPFAAVRPLREELGLPPTPAPRAEQPPDARRLVTMALEEGARVVSVGLGDPGAVADIARDAGAPLVAMAASVADAVRAVESGADVIVAQGSEAGGHRSTFDVPRDGTVPLVGTMALVPQVVDAVDVPVVAAGGIMDGRGLAAAIALGAQGVQMGTAFLVAAESGAPEGYRRRVARARDTDTVITRAVSGRPARGIRNRLIETLESAGPPALGYPAQNAASAELRAAAARADEPELLALWAGQAAGLAGAPRPAAEILRAAVDEAVAVIRRLADAAG